MDYPYPPPDTRQRPYPAPHCVICGKGYEDPEFGTPYMLPAPWNGSFAANYDVILCDFHYWVFVAYCWRFFHGSDLPEGTIDWWKPAQYQRLRAELMAAGSWTAYRIQKAVDGGPQDAKDVL